MPSNGNQVRHYFIGVEFQVFLSTVNRGAQASILPHGNMCLSVVMHISNQLNTTLAGTGELHVSGIFRNGAAMFEKILRLRERISAAVE